MVCNRLLLHIFALILQTENNIGDFYKFPV